MKSNTATAVHALVMSMATSSLPGDRDVPPSEALVDDKQPLEEINGGYQDLMDGRNIRGVIVHQHGATARRYSAGARMNNSKERPEQ